MHARSPWKLLALAAAIAAVVVLTFTATWKGLVSPDVATLLGALAVGITFNSVPTNLRVPFFAVEFDSSKSAQGAALLSYRALLIGQKRTAGTGVANTLYKVTSADQVSTLAGRGSMLHRQAIAFFNQNKFTECWIGILDDNGAGVAATGTITVTGPATAAGTIYLYLGGTRITVAVASGDVQNTIATNINTAINAELDLPVTSTVATNVVTLTHRHKGEVGNDFDLRVNYQDGESLPTGVSLAFVAMASGATNPVLTTLIAALGDNWYQIWAHGYKDATSLTAIETELSSRFGPMRMIDGVAFTSATGTQSTLSTLGDTRNNQHSVIVAQPGKNPLTPPSEFAAAVAGVVALYGSADPARPFHTLPLVGMVAPKEADRFTLTEQNLMLYDGISTSTVGAGGVVQLGGMVTTYQKNSANVADTSYLYINTMLTLLYLRYSLRNNFLTRFPRHKLGDDGARVGAGQAVLTPKIAKAECIAWFRQMEELGLVENFAQFKTDLVVQRSATDRNRLEMLVPPDLMNQFVVGAAQVQFRQ
jgi:phage tail sheath gpL-like